MRPIRRCTTLGVLGLLFASPTLPAHAFDRAVLDDAVRIYRSYCQPLLSAPEDAHEGVQQILGLSDETAIELIVSPDRAIKYSYFEAESPRPFFFEFESERLAGSLSQYCIITLFDSWTSTAETDAAMKEALGEFGSVVSGGMMLEAGEAGSERSREAAFILQGALERHEAVVTRLSISDGGISFEHGTQFDLD